MIKAVDKGDALSIKGLVSPKIDGQNERAKEGQKHPLKIRCPILLVRPVRSFRFHDLFDNKINNLVGNIDFFDDRLSFELSEHPRV